MDVSIILVSYNTKDLTIDCIRSIYDKTSNINYEIFVVDNDSKDGSAEAVESLFPNVNVIRNSINAGFGAANNIAIRQAKGKYIFCLNTDTILLNNAIKILFDFMEKSENLNVGACGGTLVDKDDKICPCGGNLPNITEILWKFGLRYIFKNQYKKYKLTLTSDDCASDNIGYISGANIFFRKSVLDKVGIFDETFFLYYEETDLCKRITDAGFNIKLIKESKIKHLEGSSCKNSLIIKKRTKKSEYIYFKKHLGYGVIFIKILYIILYLIDWIFFRNQDSKELLKYTINNSSDKV